MELKINTNSILQEGDEERLRTILNLSAEQDLAEAISQIALAAFNEYIDMLLGRGLASRAAEIRERRLLYLLKHYFTRSLPSEAEISSIFQLTETASRGLLRSTRTKFKTELSGHLHRTITEVLESAAQQADGSHRVVIQSENVLEELRLTVSIRGPQLDQISKVRGSASLYDIPEDTFALLLAHYGQSE